MYTTHSHLVVDPFVQAFVPSGLRALAASKRHAWQQSSRDSYCQRRVKKLLAKWDEASFLAEAWENYVQFHDAFALGQRARMRDLLTEPAFTALKKQSKQSPLGFRMLELAEPAEIVRSRLLPVDPKDADKSLAQLTLRFRTAQQIVAREERKSRGKRGGGGGGSRGGSTFSEEEVQSFLHAREEVGEWRVCFRDDGALFYSHTATGESSWTRPPSYGRVVAPLPLAGNYIGPWQGGLPEDVDESARPSVHEYENVVVFEKPLFIDDVPWRIMKP
eukprot:PLAT498.1.p2 GENE.PLAT498.1~~PLAT498.1.p2  ORF type:complete len:292 (+),score=120.67 PLAT498.1:53-877(+)